MLKMSIKQTNLKAINGDLFVSCMLLKHRLNTKYNANYRTRTIKCNKLAGVQSLSTILRKINKIKNGTVKIKDTFDKSTFITQ